MLADSLTQAKLGFQCVLMRILSCDFSVKYIKGSTNQIANCPQRFGPLDDKIKLPIIQVHEVTSKLQASVSMIQPYWNFYEEIIIDDGFLCSRPRITITTNQRQALLKQISAGYLGLSKCLHRIRQGINWPELYGHIYELVNNFQTSL